MNQNSLKISEMIDTADKVELIKKICSLQRLPEKVVIKFLEAKGALKTLQKKSFNTAENE